MNYYTSDLHLGHENIIAPMNRPYNNATEMDEDLVKRWNKKVKEFLHYAIFLCSNGEEVILY